MGRSRTAPSKGSARPPRVVGLGLCVQDELLVVEDLSAGRPRTRYRERRLAPGGMVAVALAQAAQLGCRAELVSAVGDDAAGRRVLADLRCLSVSTRRVLRMASHPTTVSVVIVDAASAERRFLLPDRRRLEREAPDLDPGPLRGVSVLLVDGHFGRSALVAARRARERGIPVVGDFCDLRPAHRRLLPLVDHPIVPEEFVDALGAGGPEETLAWLHETGGGSPVVTLGERGSLAWIEGRVVHVPARPVRARDTTGAGDAFHGAFAAALAHGWAPRRALALAARAAAQVCTGLGGTARLLRDPRLPGPPQGPA